VQSFFYSEKKYWAVDEKPWMTLKQFWDNSCAKNLDTLFETVLDAPSKTAKPWSPIFLLEKRGLSPIFLSPIFLGKTWSVPYFSIFINLICLKTQHLVRWFSLGLNGI